MGISTTALWGSLFIGFLALIFAFSNGFRDSSTIVATVVSTRALSPRRAFMLCSLFEFLGAFFVGTAVIATIGKGLFEIPIEATKLEMILLVGAALTAAILWGAISWWRAWPISNNQALLGGLIGASSALWGFDHLRLSVILVVLGILILSPLMGFFISSLLTSLIRFLGNWLTPKATAFIQRLHIGSCLLVSCAHGSNDGQIITGLLVLAFGVMNPSLLGLEMGSTGSLLWVRFLVAFVFASGVLLGGKRILKKLGMKFFRIKPSQGLGAQLSSAGTILSCALTGFPASTMQVVTGSVIGAGVAKNAKAIRWNLLAEIVLSWFITMPTAGLLGFGICSAFMNGV